jgi:hypothetical protein
MTKPAQWKDNAHKVGFATQFSEGDHHLILVAPTKAALCDILRAGFIGRKTFRTEWIRRAQVVQVTKAK